MLRDVWRAHQNLPSPLQAQWLVPGTMVLVGLLGFTVTLRSGPLCDEGMVLFMEGGCDWGESNVFFYSKLGTMLALNGAFVVAWRSRVRDILAFMPHFLVAAWLAWRTRSGGSCDTYYSHPNGSVGQMVVELAAYGFLGLAILKVWSGGTLWRMAVAMVGWTAAYVLVFYFALIAAPHWTWSHTFLVAGLMSLLGVIVRRRQGRVGQDAQR